MTDDRHHTETVGIERILAWWKSQKAPMQFEMRWGSVGKRWELRYSGNVLLAIPGLTKAQALRQFASYSRRKHEETGLGVRLMICLKSGRRYEKGRNAERSYGADSRRRPG